MAIAPLLDQLESLVRDAKPVPILGGARAERGRIYDTMDLLRLEVGKHEWLDEDRVVVRGAGLLVPLDELDEAVHDAKPVPLTGQIRFDRDEMLALVARVREGAAQDRIVTRAEVEANTRELRSRLLAVVDRLDQLLQSAMPVPLTDEVRVRGEDAYAILEDLRRDAPVELRPQMDAFADVVAKARPVPLTDQVRVKRDKLLTIIQQMRAVFSQGTPAAPTN